MLIASLLAVACAADLAVFAGRFYPYLDPALASPPVTPAIAFLQSQPKPFRIAPFFDYLWPNSSAVTFPRRPATGDCWNGSIQAPR